MNPLQLRETTMNPDTRRLVQLTLEPGDNTNSIMDMLLAKKRASRSTRMARNERQFGRFRQSLNRIYYRKNDERYRNV